MTDARINALTEDTALVDGDWLVAEVGDSEARKVSVATLRKSILAINYETRSTNTILGAADKGKAVDITATITQTFEADETLGDGWWVILRNATDEGTVVVTLNPDGAETIDGLATVTMYSGETRMILCNGAAGNFNSILLGGGFVRFTADDNFIVPHGITSVTVDCIGAGGGGGGARGGSAGSERNGGSGGGGGARSRREFGALALGNPGDTIAVDIGAGGTSGGGGSAGNGSNGGTGDPTTFGSTMVRAHGGGPGFGGASSTNNRTGGGGGGIGEAGQIGADNTNSRGGTAAAGGGIGHGGEGGGDATGGTGGGAEDGGAAGGHTFGGGGGNATSGGGSVFGGSGGGAGADIPASNTERTGGAGGVSGVWALAGTVGGGGATNGGAGAPGAAGNSCKSGSGGAGGGSQDSGTGGVGGVGGAPGGGGGGGGGGTTVGGAGGVGGIGECRVTYS